MHSITGDADVSTGDGEMGEGWGWVLERVKRRDSSATGAERPEGRIQECCPNAKQLDISMRGAWPSTHAPHLVLIGQCLFCLSLRLSLCLFSLVISLTLSLVLSGLSLVHISAHLSSLCSPSAIRPRFLFSQYLFDLPFQPISDPSHQPFFFSGLSPVALLAFLFIFFFSSVFLVSLACSDPSFSLLVLLVSSTSSSSSFPPFSSLLPSAPRPSLHSTTQSSTLLSNSSRFLPFHSWPQHDKRQ